MSGFADVCSTAYRNKESTDKEFLGHYRSKNWAECGKIARKECYLIVCHQASKKLRGRIRDDHLEDAVYDLAEQVISKIARNILDGRFHLIGQSISNYLSGAIRNANNNYGNSFRPKDFPKAIRSAGAAAIDLYNWRVKHEEPRDTCAWRLRNLHQMDEKHIRELFELVASHHSGRGKVSIQSLDAYVAKDGTGTTTHEVPSHAYLPDILLENKELRSIVFRIIGNLPKKEAAIITVILERGDKNIAKAIRSEMKLKSPYAEIKKAKDGFRRELRKLGIDRTLFS